MTTPRTLLAAVTAAVALSLSAAASSRPEALEGRLVAIADVHGAGGAFVKILQRTGLIDEQQKWIGGSAVFVQTGDLLDRGTEIKPVLDLLMALESQASAAGGRVQVLLGNHEGITMLGETRDAAQDVYRAFADEKSESRREQGFQAAKKIAKGTTLDKDKDAWMAAHPPGYIEYRDAFAPNGRYGKWLRGKPVVVEIDGTVFMHGGINPTSAPDPLDAINKRARQDLSEWDRGLKWLIQHDLALPFSTLQEIVAAASDEYARLAARAKADGTLSGDAAAAEAILPIVNVAASTFVNSEGPVWFRGYSTWTDEEGAPLMEGLLKKYKVKRFITGHTPQPSGRIGVRFNNTLYLIDTGMLDGKFYPNGRPSAVEIKGDVVTPVYVE